MIKRHNKNGEVLVIATIVFLVFIIVMFSFAFVKTAKASKESGVYEQLYAKELALLLDNIREGTEISINLASLSSFRTEEFFPEIRIIRDSNEVFVKLNNKQKSGYYYKFFVDNKPLLIDGDIRSELKINFPYNNE